MRDEGYMKIVPNAVNALLSKAGVSAGDIAHFILPTDQGRVPPMVAKKLGIKGEAVADNLLQSVGITGAAHAMLLLAFLMWARAWSTSALDLTTALARWSRSRV